MAGRGMLAAATALAGCATDSPPDLATVRDSAGITIVESTGAAWGHTDPAPIVGEALLELGSLDGSEEDRFFRVRGIRWIDDDRFVLSNGDTQVRVYDRSGELQHQFGREGDGPEDYLEITEIGPLADDRLLVVDNRRRSVRVTSLEGAVREETTFEYPVNGESVADHHLILRAPQTLVPPGTERRLDSLVSIDTDSGTRVVLTTVPGAPVLWRDLPNGRPTPMSFGNGPGAVVEARHGRIVYGSSDVYELRELDASGTLVRILRRPVAARVPTAETGRPMVERWVEVGSPEYARPVFADSLPHFRAFLLDDAGRTWVQRDPGYGHPAVEWDLFGADGVFLGPVELPADFTPHDIRDDRMIGVRTDAFEVEHIQILRVQLPGGLSVSLPR